MHAEIHQYVTAPLKWSLVATFLAYTGLVAGTAALTVLVTLRGVGAANVEPDTATDLTLLIGFILAAYISFALQADRDTRTAVASMLAAKPRPSLALAKTVLIDRLVPDAAALLQLKQETEPERAVFALYVLQLACCVPWFHAVMMLLLLVYYGVVMPWTGCVETGYWVVIVATRNFGIIFSFYLCMIRVASPLTFDPRLREFLIKSASSKQ
jgi:hypothetical protein